MVSEKLTLSIYLQALKANRDKAYQDFIAVGEHLIESGICKPQTLAARGGSNGGLLMGNMYTMRPDLFGAIHCAVPLVSYRSMRSEMHQIYEADIDNCCSIA